MTPEELEARFTYHPPKNDQAERYRRIRSDAAQLAALLDDLVPESREKSLALTNLEQAVMWSNAAIARRE